jgi:protein O-mannosyl-transferase
MSDNRRRLSLLVLLAAAYASAPTATFQFDDWNIVVGNHAVHGLAAWLASMPGMRPLTKLSYALNWSVDARPFGFALVGVALHVANVLLVYALLRRWLVDLAPRCPRIGVAAWIAAACFALHPAQTEAVTYIAGRSVVLAACLSLAALYAWERGREGDWRWRWTSALAFALAMAARETAWTVPFAIMLVEAARGRRTRQTLGALVPHLSVLAIAAAAIVALPAYRRLLATSLALRGPLDNLVAQASGMRYLVTHPLATLRVNIDPDVPVAVGAGALLPLFAIAGAIVAGFVVLPRLRWLGFAILWFFLQLAPTNGPIARLDIANDRQLYLALIGPALLLAVPLATWRRRVLAPASAAILLAALIVATWFRNLDYRSEVALWEATVRASPAKARVHNNLGIALRDAGEHERARRAFERAVALDPADYKAERNLRELR